MRNNIIKRCADIVVGLSNKVLLHFGYSLHKTILSKKLSNKTAKIKPEGTIVKFLDIQFDLEAINRSLVARRSGLSTTYTNELILGIRYNLESKKIIRDTIVAIYTDAVRFNDAN